MKGNHSPQYREGIGEKELNPKEASDMVKKEVIPAYITGAIMNLPLFMNFVYLPTYVRALGATDFQIGLLSTFYFLILIFSSPFWGALSDLIENRKLFSLGSIGSLFLIFLLISKSEDPTELILLRGGIALVFPAFSTPLLAFISEHSSISRRV